jgi:hypothetical protein
MKIYIRTMITTTTFIFYANSSCVSEISQKAIEAKKASESAMSDAKGADLTRSAKFEKASDKEKAIREKAMSALTSAVSALSSAEAIMEDPKESPESKHITTEIEKEAKEAIKKAGEVLARG